MDVEGDVVIGPSQQARIVSLLADFEPRIRDAFLASIQGIVDNAELNRLVDALERGDIEGAVRAIHVDAPAYQHLDNVVRQSYVEAGTETTASLPRLFEAEGRRAVIRFDVRNPRAETWLLQHSSDMVREIMDDQLYSIRLVLSQGMIEGDNPRATGLNIIGRVNPISGRREGGIIGLTSAQERYVDNARRELATGEFRAYLARGRRNKRFDAVVRRAIESGKGLDRDTINRITGAYSDRLLQLRGETIGRTESMAAIHEASAEAYRQAVEKGTLLAANVRKIWKATRDERTRDTHRELDGQSVGLNERFSNGLLYPGDPSGDIAERANCRCRPIYKIDRFAGLE